MARSEVDNINIFSPQEDLLDMGVKAYEENVPLLGQIGVGLTPPGLAIDAAEAAKYGRDAFRDFRQGSIGSGLANTGIAALSAIGLVSVVGDFAKIGGKKLLKPFVKQEETGIATLDRIPIYKQPQIVETEFVKKAQGDIVSPDDLYRRSTDLNKPFQNDVAKIANDLQLEKAPSTKTLKTGETINVETKTLESIEDKMIRGKKPSEITDGIRTRVYVNTPEDGDEIVRLLNKKYALLDEGEKIIKQTGFQARNINLRVVGPNNQSVVAEVQLITKPMADAADITHPMYKQQRSMRKKLYAQGVTDIPREVIQQEEKLITMQKEIFDEARKQIDPTFTEKIVVRKRYGGYIGKEGKSFPMTPNFSSNSALESMMPLSKKSPTWSALATTQSDSSMGMYKPLKDSGPEGAKTAGPLSQSKYFNSLSITPNIQKYAQNYNLDDIDIFNPKVQT